MPVVAILHWLRSDGSSDGGSLRMPNYLDVEVSLDDVAPRVWRRFLLWGRAWL